MPMTPPSPPAQELELEQEQEQTHQQPPLRKRARQACVACNAKRVKCNVTDELPCRNCSHAGLQCEVRESRRGKHPRFNSHKGGAIVGTGGAAAGASASARRLSASSRIAPEHVRALGRPHGRGHGHRPSMGQLDEVAASEVLATLSRDRQTDLAVPEDHSHIHPLPPPHHHHHHHHHRHHPSLGQPNRVHDLSEEEGSVFLGESTALRYVPTPAHDSESPESLRLLHQVPSASNGIEHAPPEWELEKRQSKLRSLQAEGAFSFPDGKVVEALLRVYFVWFHPCFAVIDEPDVWQGYREGTLSPLLLNAILFISVIHSDEPSLLALGLGTQARAKYVFYNRAKDIYDADYEPGKLTIIQSLFLMSFWRNGPLLEKDARHWLAAAISLAQTKAMHRSASAGGCSGDSKLEGIKKRTWWSIYVRERQCAAALGLPMRIRDEDCDLAMLQPRDFEHAFVGATPPQLAGEYAAYQIGMAGLSQLLGRIIHGGYLPGKSLTATQKASIREDAAAWKRRLPEVMQMENDLEGAPNMHSTMLHLAYNNLLILLHRPDYIASSTSAKITSTADDGIRDRDGIIALQAAARNSRLIEDLLPGGVLRHAQVHVITNLFNTLCIHTIHLRRAEGTAVTIAEHRAKICLLGLQELQRTWEVRNWILQLFFQYLDRSTAARLLAQDDATAVAAASAADREANGGRRGGMHSRNGSLAQSAVSSGQNGVAIGAYTSDAQGAAATVAPGSTAPGVPSTPWSWSTEEQNQYLFSQIENNYAFGEGGNYEWRRPETAPSPMLPNYGEQQNDTEMTMIFPGGGPRGDAWQVT